MLAGFSLAAETEWSLLIGREQQQPKEQTEIKGGLHVLKSWLLIGCHQPIREGDSMLADPTEAGESCYKRKCQSQNSSVPKQLT